MIKTFFLQPDTNKWYDLELIEEKFSKLNWFPESR